MFTKLVICGGLGLRLALGNLVRYPGVTGLDLSRPTAWICQNSKPGFATLRGWICVVSKPI